MKKLFIIVCLFLFSACFENDIASSKFTVDATNVVVSIDGKTMNLQEALELVKGGFDQMNGRFDLIEVVGAEIFQKSLLNVYNNCQCLPAEQWTIVQPVPPVSN